VLGTGKLYFTDTKLGINTTKWLAHLAEVSDGAAPVDWDHAEKVDLKPSELAAEPEGGATFASLPASATKAKNYEKTWDTSYGNMLFRTEEVVLLHAPGFEESSKPDEEEGAFRARLAQHAREKRDQVIARARAKFAPKLAALQERLRRAEQAVEVQRSQARNAQVSTAVSFGSAVLGALLGRKTMSAGNVSRAATAARGVSRSAREAGDVGRAEESVEAVRAQMQALDEAFKAEVRAETGDIDASSAELEELVVRVKKSNVSVTAMVLAWAPVWVEGGEERRAW
jgi:hypothetical protein